MIQNFKHQDQAFAYLQHKLYGALFMEMGTGKTRVAIQLMEDGWRRDKFNAVLVVVPKSIIGNWEIIELPKHSTLPYRVIRWKLGLTASDIERYTHGSRLIYFITSAESFLSQRFIDCLKIFIRDRPKFAMLVDESTKFKSFNAKRLNVGKQIARRATKRIIMSGFPITNSPLDIWGQSELLKDGLLGRSYYAFRARHAITKKVTKDRDPNAEESSGPSRTYTAIVGYKNLEDLRNNINKWAFIVKKEDCLDLPPKVYRRVPVELTMEQHEAYETLRRTAVLEIEGVQFTAVNTLALVSRLMQICAGQLKKADGEYISFPTNRIDALIEELEGTAEKAVIWCPFVQATRDIVKALGDKAMHLASGLDVAPRMERINAWSKGSIQSIVSNQMSNAHGSTFVEAPLSFYYANTHHSEPRVQSEDRTHRIGQLKTCVYTDFYVPGSVEERVLEIVQSARSVSEFIISREKALELIGGPLR